MDKIFVIEYNGQFGFIKPFSSFRDELTFSQTFLTKSTLIGIEYKVFKEFGYSINGELQKIVRYRLKHDGFSSQQETIMSPNIKFGKSKNNIVVTEGGCGVITRHVLVNPTLYLGLNGKTDAEIMIENIIKLSRNEDLLFPKPNIVEMTEEEFTLKGGMESFDDESGFLVGYNRYDNFKPMLTRIEFSE